MIRALDPLVSLPASDPARAHRFYSETLGLRCVAEFPDDGFYLYAAGESDARLLGIHRHDGPLPPPEMQGVWLWLQVESLAAARARLEGAGVRFVGEPSPLGPGTQQPFLDSEGNVLRLWEMLQEVRRGVDLAASPEDVFRAVTEAAVVERWFEGIHDVRIEPGPGGAVSFVDPVFGAVTGRVAAWEPPRRVRFEFDANWPRHLELTIEPRGRLTRLEVRQWDFAPIADRDFGIPALVESLDAAMAVLERASELGFAALVAKEIAGELVRDLRGRGRRAR